MFDFDLFVIGAGSGGVRTARMSASYGARVAIAEDRYMGVPVSMLAAYRRNSIPMLHIFVMTAPTAKALVGREVCLRLTGMYSGTTRPRK